MSQLQSYLQPEDANVIRLMQRNVVGPIVMLNLLKLRTTADYSDHPELDPGEPISGRAAYAKYVNHTMPFLHESGGDLLYLGSGDRYLIGPVDEGWDLVMMVEQRSVQAFLDFATNADCMAGLGHRDAAVADSRILPLQTQDPHNL